MTAIELASALGNYRKMGKNYRVSCVAHEDKTPSLDIADGRSGVMLICRAGCSQRDIIRALDSMGLWENSERPAIDFKMLHKARLWRDGLVDHTEQKLEAVKVKLLAAFEADQEPTPDVAARVFRYTQLCINLRGASEVSLMEFFQKASEKNRKYVNRCISWTLRRDEGIWRAALQRSA